ncbi:MAG: hypothetical protein NTW28_18085 [Candidatus Solibacter sp.]|nr:hypothetical protein [Candidatus Solibacter sp.]
MRAIGIMLLIPWMVAAQAVHPPGPPENAPLVRGVLLECDTHAAGELSIRAADNRVLRYQFDRLTYVEREDRLIEPARLAAGEKVEVVSEAVAGYPLRYARTIHVIQPAAPARPQTLGRLRAYDPKTEPAIRAGNITFSGVVFRLNSQRVVLHTREAGDLSILLRKDTRYLADGQLVDAESLKPNMRVFVRAGKDLYNEVEAYQVIWGRILNPR